jgi:hypothetical protein
MLLHWLYQSVQRPLSFVTRRRGKPARPRSAWLRVETLEQRWVPTGTPNQNFVAQAYLDVLQRPADASEVALWSGQLDQGASRVQVVLGIENSSEYRTLQVEQAYSHLLNRPADAFGLSYFTSFLAGGGTVEQMDVALGGSPDV